MARLFRATLGLAVASLICLLVLVVPTAPVAAPAFGRNGPRHLRLPLGFSLRASNGYRIDVFHSSAHRIELFASRIAHGREQTASYDAPGSFNRKTRTIEAKFGSLGQVEMVFHRRGERRLHLKCADKNLRVATGSFTGTFSFSGEEGFTSATANHAPAVAFPKFLIPTACGEKGMIRGSGPGVELDSWKGSRLDNDLGFSVTKKKPTAKPRFAASVKDAQGDMQIERGVGNTGQASSFTHNRRLTKAAVSNPPAPFTGEAVFKQGPGNSGQWTGTLAVSFPGESNVSLAGAGFGGHLYAFRAG